MGWAMRAVILSTGDELTTGRTLDTNAHFIADQLVGVGIDVVGMMVVGDYPDRIAWVWRQALEHADVVLCTVQDGGHQWPGGGTLPFLGKKSDNLIATEALWSFFVAHPRR